MDLLARLEDTLGAVAAPLVRSLGLRLLSARLDEVELVMPVTPTIVHGGGVVCGQSLLAAADTAMILAVCTDDAGFRPMTTVQLQTSFMRPIPGDADQVTVICRVLRRGRSLVFGEVELKGPDGRLAAHTTTTYALL